MKKFIIKTAIFLIPIVLLYIFPLVVIFLSKEYYTVQDVVDIQNKNKNVLYRNTYNTGSFIPYKKLLFETNDPDIFMLGSSRALQTKKEFFNSNAGKYINAGLAGKTMSDIKYFIKDVVTHTKPRTLLLVIDREMLLMNPEDSNAHFDDYSSLFGFHFHLPLANARGIYIDYFLRHKYSFTDLFHSFSNNDTLGMTAFADKNGFRSDGSYRNYIESKDGGLATRVIDEANLLANNMLLEKDTFSSTDDRNIEANMKAIQEILLLCKEKNITVIGFIPPYMTPINKAMLDPHSLKSEKYIFIANNLKSIFKINDSSFYDLSDISLYDGRDSEFLDTIHGTDLIYAKLGLYLAQQNKILGKYFNIQALKDMIKNSQGNFLEP